MRRSQIITAVCRLALTGVAACVGCTAVAAELWELEWIEVETDHFTIATPLARDDALRFAEELENFRAVAPLFLKLGTFEERVPTKIYLVPEAYPELGLGERFAGYFRPGLRENHAVVASWGGTPMLKHEYVHFLISNFDSQLYPLWLEEGLAEVLSTMTVRDGVLEYGLLIPGRIETLLSYFGEWLHFDSILEQRDTESLSVRDLDKFYAQSWLLTQYLTIGRADGRELTSQVEEFLRRVEAGASDKTAFHETFDVRVNQLETTLKAYVRRRVPGYAVRLSQPLPPVTANTRSMPRDQVAVELAVVMFQSGSSEKATQYCERALELNPENSLAVVCSAESLLMAERFDEAEVVFRRAQDMDPTNAAREVDYGVFLMARAIAEADAAETSERVAPLLAEARRRFARLNAANPDNAEVLFLNGVTYLIDESDAAKAVASLEAAHALVPGDVDTQAALAQAYVKNGEPERARRILLRLLAWLHRDDTGEIRAMLASIDAAPPAADSE